MQILFPRHVVRQASCFSTRMGFAAKYSAAVIQNPVNVFVGLY
jgi:hypothetical protein